MKLREYFSLYKELLKSKGLIVLRCPYCGTFDVTYNKESLKEYNCEHNGKLIKYRIRCNRCDGKVSISEYWGEDCKNDRVEGV